MTPLIEKYLDKEKINQIRIEKQYDDLAFQEYLNFIERTLQGYERYGYDEEEEKESDTYAYFNEYMVLYIAERGKGFSHEWSSEHADRCFGEEHSHAAAYAFSASYKQDEQQALNDLQVFTNLLNQDHLFFEHFLFLTKIEAPNVTPCFELQAAKYSKIYKEQIEKGRSKVFANKYADDVASDVHTEYGCLVEAAEYEKALNEGQPENYASVFALHISDYIVNYCSSYEEALEDELVDLERKELEKKYQHLK